MVLPLGAKRFIDRSFPCANQESAYGLAPMVEDQDGRVIAIDNDGLVRWEGHSWRHINQDSGLLFSNRINAVAFDATGDLWLGSSGKGLINWSGYQNWESWSNTQRLPSPVVWSISTRANRVIIGTGKGPAWIDVRTGAVAPLFAERLWKYGEVSAVGTNSDGSYWVGTLTGTVLRIDPKTGRTNKLAKLPAYIMSALGLPDGHLFFATKQGLWVSKDGHAPHHAPAADALLGSSTTVEAACAAPDGAAWFLGDNRLLRFKNGAWSAPPIEGLPKLNGALLALSCAADGSVWATGLRTGTWRMALDHERLKASPLSLPAEFSLLAPLAISVDQRGWVWLGTDMGLMVWNGKTWRHLTEESGLIWNDVNQSAIFSADDGSLWVGTSSGVSHLMHPERVFNQVSLAISLTDMRRGAVNYLGMQQLNLPWAGSPLSFRFSSPTTRNRSELALKYYLAGSSSEWMESPSGEATFNKLEPRAYTFMAMACNPGLGVCSAPVKVDFKILAPWWKTNGFYALCLIALLLLLAACSRLYARGGPATGKTGVGTHTPAQDTHQGTRDQPRAVAHPGDSRCVDRNAQSRRHPSCPGRGDGPGSARESNRCCRADRSGPLQTHQRYVRAPGR
jgi:sugar lactone lactonase YvrE